MSRYQFRGIELPESLKESLDAYVSTGRPTGGFLQACIENDLKDAVARADECSLAAIPAVIGYLYNEAPIGSWGKKECFRAWIKAKADEREQQTLLPEKE